MKERKRVLITVKAEPSPSKAHGDSVCTAGITDQGEFIRLYPIPYRVFCDDKTKFSKYDWIEVDCEKSDNDRRIESYKIDSESIKVVGHVNTEYGWAERNEILLPKVSKNFAELKESGASLGIIKPSEILKFEIGDTDDIDMDCKKTFQMIFEGESRLRKIPVIKPRDRRFSYKFKCDGEKTEHAMVCEDWELYESSRTWLNYYESEEILEEKIHEKFFHHFKNECNLHFFVGTHFVYKTWMIIGLYYPPKAKPSKQMKLFAL